jgi:hypothetical protein
MSNVKSQQEKKHWYDAEKFPLVPFFKKTRKTEFTTVQYVFRWLVFRFWTLDHVDFELSLVVGTDHGIGITGVLPYFCWFITIPCPETITKWIDKNTSRSQSLQKIDFENECED